MMTGGGGCSLHYAEGVFTGLCLGFQVQGLI